MAILSLHGGRRYFMAFFLVVLLGVGIVLALRWMLADMNHYSAVAVIDQWEENGAVGSLAEWESVREALDLSSALDSGEPEYYRLMALSDDWRGFAVTGEDVTPQALMASRRSALEAYRAMVERRPADPAGWAHLARMKVMVGERDEEFSRALRNALMLGNSQPDVLGEIAYTVALGWATVMADEDLKGLVVETMANALGRPRFGGVLDYLEGTSVMDDVCPVLDQGSVNQAVRRACQSSE